jgi:anti-sigma B factor antagonist
MHHPPWKRSSQLKRVKSNCPRGVSPDQRLARNLIQAPGAWGSDVRAHPSGGIFPKLQPKQAPPWSLGMTMQAQPAGRMQAATRELGEITIVDIKGRITIGEGNVMLREIMVGLLEKGKKHVLLNMTDVSHLDSAGIGELVCSHTSVRKQGGQLKLANVSKKVQELLQKTMLSAVFDIHQDETSAVKSFGLASQAAG